MRAPAALRCSRDAHQVAKVFSEPATKQRPLEFRRAEWRRGLQSKPQRNETERYRTHRQSNLVPEAYYRNSTKVKVPAPCRSSRPARFASNSSRRPLPPSALICVHPRPTILRTPPRGTRVFHPSRRHSLSSPKSFTKLKNNLKSSALNLLRPFQAPPPIRFPPPPVYPRIRSARAPSTLYPR